MTSSSTVVRSPLVLLSLAGLTAAMSGCVTPLDRQSEQSLRHSVVESVRREVAAAETAKQPLTTIRDSKAGELSIKPAFLPELERMAGINSYDRGSFPMTEDLLGGTQKIVKVSLKHVVKTAVSNNLNLQFARIQPAINEAQVVAAEAQFDWIFFSSLNWDSIDSPRQRQSFGGIPAGSNAEVRQSVSPTAGVRRQTTTGGTLTVQQQLTYSDNESPGTTLTPDPANEVAVTLQFDQPLLRNFGSDVNEAQIRLARNQERDAIAAFKRETLQTITQTEQAYWRLVLAQRELLILQRLLERGITVRDQLANRQILDVTPAQLSDAIARVESRRADVLRAQNVFRKASDQLKALINDPELTVGSEVLLVPIEDPVDAPVQYSLWDSMMTAVANRPEVQQAILSIDNTSIRQQVADNARLPQLDLRTQVQFGALDNDWGTAYSDVFNGQFIDYLAGLNFEAPIGNRRAEADFRRRRLERMQAVIAYRNTIQQVTLEVKDALRDVVTNYRLIEQTRTARLAAAENLRALQVQKEVLQGYTVDFLDLELRRQEALAQAEREEVGALANYNNSIAQLHAAIGTALERNQIEFVVPDAGQSLANFGSAR